MGLVNSVCRYTWGLWTVRAQLLELKNGETYNGHMVACDSWMNVHLREVICTSKVCQRHSSFPPTDIWTNSGPLAAFLTAAE